VFFVFHAQVGKTSTAYFNMSTASASAHAMEKDSPRFSGMLMMEGSGMLSKTWKLRFCELRGAELRYFA
jgi:hypothetical protein